MNLILLAISKTDVNILSQFAVPAHQASRTPSWLHAEPPSRRSGLFDMVNVDDETAATTTSPPIPTTLESDVTPDTSAATAAPPCSSTTTTTTDPSAPHTSTSASSFNISMQSLAGLVIPYSVPHPGLARLLHIYEGSEHVYLVFQHAPLSLKDMLNFSPLVNDCTAWRLFAIYQLLQVLHTLHCSGMAHGNLSPSTITTTPLGWLMLSFFGARASQSTTNSTAASPSTTASISTTTLLAANQKLTGGISKLKSSNTMFCRWLRHEISNYDYLLHLNHLAGRRYGMLSGRVTNSTCM
jgi:hypothetical protein